MAVRSFPTKSLSRDSSLSHQHLLTSAIEECPTAVHERKRRRSLDFPVKPSRDSPLSLTGTGGRGGSKGPYLLEPSTMGWGGAKMGVQRDPALGAPSKGGGKELQAPPLPAQHKFFRSHVMPNKSNKDRACLKMPISKLESSFSSLVQTPQRCCILATRQQAVR